MANDNAPFGFRAVQDSQGSGVLSLEWYRIADNHTTSAIYHGDPIKLASGYALRITAGDAVAGIALAFRYKVTSTGTSVEAKYYDGATGKTDIWVGCVASDLEFEVQHNTALTQANIGTAYDPVIVNGSSVTGLSGTYLNSTGDGFIVTGLVARADNEFGAYQKVRGRFVAADRQIP